VYAKKLKLKIVFSGGTKILLNIIHKKVTLVILLLLETEG
jgi:hypothetical protein